MNLLQVTIVSTESDILPCISQIKHLDLWLDSDFCFTRLVNCYVNDLRQSFSKVCNWDNTYGPALRQYDPQRLQPIQKRCLRYSWGIRKFDPHISFELTPFSIINSFGARNKSGLVNPKHKFTIFTRSFSYNAPNYNNLLPSVFRSYTNANIKTQLKSYFLFNIF